MFLDEGQVRQRLRLEELIPALKRAFIEFSAGRVVHPVRSVLRVPENQGSSGGFFGVMPAVYGDVMGAKLVTFFATTRAGTCRPTRP